MVSESLRCHSWKCTKKFGVLKSDFLGVYLRQKFRMAGAGHVELSNANEHLHARTIKCRFLTENWPLAVPLSDSLYFEIYFIALEPELPRSLSPVRQ